MHTVRVLILAQPNFKILAETCENWDLETINAIMN